MTFKILNLFKREKNNQLKRKSPLKFDKNSRLRCPKCVCLEFYPLTDGGGGLNAICANCRALVQQTPFPDETGNSVRLLENDASKRFPEILEWWDKCFNRGKT